MLWLVVNEATGEAEQAVETGGEAKAKKLVAGLNERAGHAEARHLGEPVKYRAAKAEDELSEHDLAYLTKALEREGRPPGAE